MSTPDVQVSSTGDKITTKQTNHLLKVLGELAEVAPRGVELINADFTKAETFELVVHYSDMHAKVKQFVIWDVVKYKRFLKDLAIVKQAWAC